MFCERNCSDRFILTDGESTVQPVKVGKMSTSKPRMVPHDYTVHPPPAPVPHDYTIHRPAVSVPHDSSIRPPVALPRDSTIHPPAVPVPRDSPVRPPSVPMPRDSTMLPPVQPELITERLHTTPGIVCRITIMASLRCAVSLVVITLTTVSMYCDIFTSITFFFYSTGRSCLKYHSGQQQTTSTTHHRPPKSSVLLSRPRHGSLQE